MTTHGTLTPIHRDAVVAIAAAKYPARNALQMTNSQIALARLALSLERDKFNHWPYMARKS